MIREAVRNEPNILWQFVLAPSNEEPLDLIDLLAEELRHAPGHLNDRWIRFETGGRMATRRLFILLDKGRRYDADWIRASEMLLRSFFY